MTGLGQDGWPQAVFIEKDRWYSNSRPLLRQRIFHWLHADNDLCSVLLRGLALQSMNDRFHCSWPNWWAALLVVDLRVTQANIVRYGMTCSGKHGKSQGEWELWDNNKKLEERGRERERERDRKRVGRKKKGGEIQSTKNRVGGRNQNQMPNQNWNITGIHCSAQQQQIWRPLCVCVCVCVCFSRSPYIMPELIKLCPFLLLTSPKNRKGD